MPDPAIVTGFRFYAESEKRALLGEWVVGDLTLSEFCRRRGLPYDVFKKARRQFAIQRPVVDVVLRDEVDRAATSGQCLPLSAAWTPERARAVIDHWRASGLGRAAFCRRYGISVNRLDKWRRRLGDPIASSPRRWSRDEGRAVVEAWVASGKTIERFCRERGIGHSRLRDWAFRLGRHGDGLVVRRRGTHETATVLAEWATGDLSLAAFCRQRDLPYDTFKRARQRLGIERALQPGTGFIEIGGPDGRTRLLPPAAFIDITPLAKPPVAEEWVEVATHGGAVRLRKGFDPVLLHDVLGQAAQMAATSC
jgi:transposase-like protein